MRSTYLNLAMYPHYIPGEIKHTKNTVNIYLQSVLLNRFVAFTKSCLILLISVLFKFVIKSCGR